MKKLKKGDIVSLKGSKTPRIVDVVSVSKRPNEKAVTVYHISGTPKNRMYISDDLVRVK